MRGGDQQPETTLSYVSIEDRIPAEHPLHTWPRQLAHLVYPLSPRCRKRKVRCSSSLAGHYAGIR